MELWYKRNGIIAELHRAKETAFSFGIEIKRIINKYTATGFPTRFLHFTIGNFNGGKDDLIIPHWLFEEFKTFEIHVPFSPSNESFAKTFIDKLTNFDRV